MIELDETIEKQVDKALGEIERERFTEAREILSPLFQSHPHNHYIHYGMGVFFAFKGENQKAIVHFQKAVEIFPYFVEAHYNLGIAYKEEVNIAGMGRAFRKVVRLGEPDDSVCHEAKKMLAVLEKSVREVNGTDLDTFIRAQDFFEKGMSLMEKGEWMRAIDAYKESLTLNASTPQAYGNMGLCYARLGKKEAAMEAFDKALAIDPDYEVAIANKLVAEKLAPGEALETPIQIVEYYKDYKKEGRSYLEERAQELKNQPEI